MTDTTNTPLPKNSKLVSLNSVLFDASKTLLWKIVWTVAFVAISIVGFSVGSVLPGLFFALAALWNAWKAFEAFLELASAREFKKEMGVSHLVLGPGGEVVGHMEGGTTGTYVPAFPSDA
jgi:hypothetical protein